MDLTQHAIHTVLHPTAAFYPLPASQPPYMSPTTPPSVPWSHSTLNPKNRIDSLVLPLNPLWRIDGCTALGTQFFACPLFLPPNAIRPYRIDVFIPDPATLSPPLRHLLDLDITFYTHDARRITPLAITSHIVRILDHWSRSLPHPLHRFYHGLPFGSRIVLLNMPYHVKSARIRLFPTHALERQLLSIASLRRLWGQDIVLPPTLDFDQVSYVSQLHDSVCLVYVNGSSLVLKTITSHTKYLYHELRHLISIPPHIHIISRPMHLIVKRCSFGNKEAVIGYTLQFHHHGSLDRVVPFFQLHSRLSLCDKLNWSCQLVSALQHLRHKATVFYPDLRLENIVLSDAGHVVMVDFEQRGVWCEFAAPEVNAIEYMRLLAVDDKIDARIRQRYARLLDKILPKWEAMVENEGYATSPPPSDNYNVPWSCLSPTEQEACEVYMLGRVLWCIFEAKSAPQHSAAWISYLWEPVVEFPKYTTMTPTPVRNLIDQCTRGTRPGLGDLIVRRGNKLVLRRVKKPDASTPRLVQSTARKWWATEIEYSERWLQARSQGFARGNWNHNYYNRPSLRQVCDALEALRLDPLFRS
ncbi:hypothetical protein CDD82_7235 [Ophiocordyceps australis]|uniref:Protein kinase domain-containing protein n=1 Tax=Ophiocordyceps australis TaxID=1399860 RepID=A0A2C5YSG4_9HYPO|nr:hypothetical protein CDD82_7235 [Ophiocordyceps australis]